MIYWAKSKLLLPSKRDVKVNSVKFLRARETLVMITALRPTRREAVNHAIGGPCVASAAGASNALSTQEWGILGRCPEQLDHR